MRRDVFQAIADPTRREIINLIAHKSLNVNSVASQFDVSRMAIYKHVKILTECGLVIMKQQGRERYCEARLDKLSEVSDWVEQYRKLWSARFDALDEYLKVLQKPARPKKNNQKKIKYHHKISIMPASNSPIVKTTGRDVIITRLFNAPRPLVYTVWTDPKHVKQWWGPKVFTTPVVEMDVRPGGAYRFVMRSPEGDEYPMKGVYLEVVKNEKIVCTDIIEEHPPEWEEILKQYQLDHLHSSKRTEKSNVRSAVPESDALKKDNPDVLDSVMIITFEDDVNNMTKVTITNRFKSEEVRDMMLKMMMVEGWIESLESFDEELEKVK